MFVKKPWKWTMDCWEVTAKKKVVMEDSPRPRKKARKEAPAEASEEAAAEASEEAAAEAIEGGITTKRKGTSSQNTTSPPKPTLEPGVSNKFSPNKRLTRQITFALFLVCQNMCALFIVYGFYICILVKVLMGRMREGRAWRRIKVQMCPQLCPQMLVPRKIKLQNRALRRMLDIRKRGMLLWHFAVQSDRTRKLAASQQSPYTANSTARVIIPNKKLYPGYNPFAPIDKKKLKDLADWLKTCLHYRTPLDKKPRKNRTWWYQILRTSLEWLEDCMTWIAMWISIPKRHIVVFDSNCSSISPKELDVVMEPFLYMVPYLLVECASSDEQRAQYSLEPFTYDRPTNIPPARAGDYGVYTLNKKDFAKANGKTMRDKMAMDIL
ncbi:unnamed protein product [Brassica oleracea]